MLAVVVLPATVAALLLLPAVFGDDAGGLPRRVLGARPVAWVGEVSYGVYLWHFPLLVLLATPGTAFTTFAHTNGLGVDRFLPGNQTLSLAVVGVAATLVAASLSYYLVERPFLRRKRREPASAPEHVPMDSRSIRARNRARDIGRNRLPPGRDRAKPLTSRTIPRKRSLMATVMCSRPGRATCEFPGSRSAGRSPSRGPSSACRRPIAPAP